MYNTYNTQGGYPQPSAGNGNKKKEEEVLNKLQCTGTVRPRFDQDTQLTIKDYKNGNYGIQFKIVTSEPVGADENGQPKIEHEEFLVAISTNKVIPLELLKSITIGSKVYAVGPYRTREYNDKNGQPRKVRELKPYFVKIVAGPMQPTQQPYNQPYGQQAPQYNPQPAYPQSYAQGGYPQQQMPAQYPQGPQPQQAPPYYQPPQQPAYTPQGGYAPQQPQQQPQPQAPQYVPNQQPYAQRPQGGYAPGAPAPAPYGPDDDLPPDDMPLGNNISL